MKRRPQWDIFCKVIDNFGDIGICWRLACDLASRGQRVRLWADDASALRWMAPDGCPGVEVLPWEFTLAASDLALLANNPVDVLIEAFGCDVAPQFIAACAHHAGATGHKPVWINLEYLSAEPYAARSHGLPSPVRAGSAAGWTKWFFYPGFTPQTGGLLREPSVAVRRDAFKREDWLQGQGIVWQGETLVSLFCYEPPALGTLLQHLAQHGLQGRAVHLLVAAGRAIEAVKNVLKGLPADPRSGQETPGFSGRNPLQRPAIKRGLLSISYLPLLTQAGFDELLWACDINFVRGEDSIVRALWAGKPLVWQIYPQEDGVHSVKLDAFLDALPAPQSLQAFHRLWNQERAGEVPASVMAALLEPGLHDWEAAISQARCRLEEQEDLTSRLMKFVDKNR